MRMLLAVVLALGGCANAKFNGATLAASTLMLACDGMQTLRVPAGGYYETNPVIGAHPSASVISAYFLGAAMINAAVWMLTPERAKSVVPMAAIAIEANAISGNFDYGTGMCGIR